MKRKWPNEWIFKFFTYVMNEENGKMNERRNWFNNEKRVRLKKKFQWMNKKIKEERKKEGKKNLKK